jgi:hypothetical protein
VVNEIVSLGLVWFKAEMIPEVCEMILMIESTYPGTKIDEVTTGFVEYLQTNPLPEYVKIIELYSFAGGDGIRALVFFDLQKGKEGEGHRYIAGAVLYLNKAVEGYKAEGHIVSNLAQSFEVMDMEAPAV